MADFSMWGPSQSPIAVDQTQRMNEISMQEKQAQTADFQAHAKQRQAQAAAAQQKQQHDKAAQDTMQQLAMDSTVTTFEQMSTGLMKAGFPVEAAKWMESFQKTSEMKAKAEEAKAKTEELKLKMQSTSMDIMAKLVRGIGAEPDPVGAFEAIKAKIREGGQKLPPEIDNATWTPELAKRLESQAMSTKDSVEAQRKALDDKGKEELRKAQARLKAAQTEEAHQKALTEKERQVKLRKEGALVGVDKPGKEPQVKQPPKELTDLASNLILNAYPDVEVDAKGKISDPGVAASMAGLVGEAGRIFRQNKGVTQEQALNQAFMQAQKDKVF